MVIPYLYYYQGICSKLYEVKNEKEYSALVEQGYNFYYIGHKFQKIKNTNNKLYLYAPCVANYYIALDKLSFISQKTKCIVHDKKIDNLDYMYLLGLTDKLDENTKIESPYYFCSSVRSIQLISSCKIKIPKDIIYIYIQRYMDSYKHSISKIQSTIRYGTDNMISKVKYADRSFYTQYSLNLFIYENLIFEFRNKINKIIEIILRKYIFVLNGKKNHMPLFAIPTLEIAHKLLEYGISLTSKDDNGNNIIHHLVSLDSKKLNDSRDHKINTAELIKLFINYGANINEKNNDNLTPLQLCNDREILYLLLSKEASQIVIHNDEYVDIIDYLTETKKANSLVDMINFYNIKNRVKK